MKSTDLPPCDYCHNDIPSSAERCPHCGRPGLFPNVRAAERATERAALNQRYQAVLHNSMIQGTQKTLSDFETRLMDSVVSISRSASELQRLATCDTELYASYYQLLEGEVKLPKDEKWDALREAVDGALFTGYRKHIKFGALTLDGEGLSNYGDCSILLRPDMIAHRASVFEENSVLFMIHNGIKMVDASDLPPGYRATWYEREKLCVAKLAAKLHSSTKPDEYSSILLRQGKTSDDDEFVEVHIWGPMTIRTIQEVFFFTGRKHKLSSIINKANKERLKKWGIDVKE